eukprot:gene31153-32266_t
MTADNPFAKAGGFGEQKGFTSSSDGGGGGGGGGGESPFGTAGGGAPAPANPFAPGGGGFNMQKGFTQSGSPFTGF